MRQSTLSVIAFVLAFPIVHLLPYLAESSGLIELPRWSLMTTAMISAIGSGITTVLLMPLNRRVLAWRKERGRDIEAEEHHESSHGVISLFPDDK